MSRRLSLAFHFMRRINEDDEVLTFRVYRDRACIDEFTGTKAEWFDRVLATPFGQDNRR